MMPGLLVGQKRVELGIAYNYGAAFNFHQSNKKKWPPTDASTPALFFHLDAGQNQLGLRASLGWRKEEIRFHVVDRFYMKQTNNSLELKLQPTLHISSNSYIALGFAPRILVKTSYQTEYKNELTKSFYGESSFSFGQDENLNKFNSSIALSWYYNFAKHWQASAHLDYDVINIHKDDIGTGFLLDTSFRSLERHINARLTCVSIGLGFFLHRSITR